jgi:hypothetical protein
METNIIPIPDKRRIQRMKKEDVAIDMGGGAEAEKEIERQPIPDRFSYHKEGEALEHKERSTITGINFSKDANAMKTRNWEKV